MMDRKKAFIVGIKSTKLSKKEITFLKKHKPWGNYSLFKKYKLN